MTYLSLMSEPPQKNWLSFNSIAIQGYSLTYVKLPPTMPSFFPRAPQAYTAHRQRNKLNIFLLKTNKNSNVKCVGTTMSFSISFFEFFFVYSLHGGQVSFWTAVGVTAGSKTVGTSVLPMFCRPLA